MTSKIELHEKEFFTKEGKRIAYYDIGKGTPIILIHGWLACKEVFVPLIKKLGVQKNFRIIAIDLPGFGNSSSIDVKDYTDRTSKILDEFINKLDIHDVCLFGNSFGGIMSLIYSYYYPDSVKKIIIRSTPLYYEQLPKLVSNDLFFKFIEQSSKIERTQELYRKAIEVFYRKYISQFKDEYIDDKLINLCVSNIKKLDTKVAREIILYVLKIDIRNYIDKNNKPVLIFANKKDLFVSHKKIDYERFKNVKTLPCEESHNIFDLNTQTFDLIVEQLMEASKN